MSLLVSILNHDFNMDALTVDCYHGWLEYSWLASWLTQIRCPYDVRDNPGKGLIMGTVNNAINLWKCKLQFLACNGVYHAKKALFLSKELIVQFILYIVYEDITFNLMDL